MTQRTFYNRLLLTSLTFVFTTHQIHMPKYGIQRGACDEFLEKQIAPRAISSAELGFGIKSDSAAQAPEFDSKW